MSINAEIPYVEPGSNKTYSNQYRYVEDQDQIEEEGDSDNEEMYTKTPN